MLLIAGLGNPGARHANNRHNIGFMAVAAIARTHRIGPFRARLQGLIAEGLIGQSRVALLAQALQLDGQFRDLRLAGPFARFALIGPGCQPGALLQPFLFLRGQALNLINNRINLLVQQPLGIVERVELAFMRGDGHFLRAQFNLRLLQPGLKFGLLALQGAFAAANFGHFFLQAGQGRPQVSDLVFPAQN